MDELLVPLMHEYQRLLKVEKEFEDWKQNNPKEKSWAYRGQRVSKARFKRIGVMIRQTMIDFERKHSPY